MKRILIAVAAAGALLMGRPAGAAPSAEFVVIVNSANPVTSLTAAETSKLFLKKSKKWEVGETVVPVDLPESAPARIAFTREVHKKAVGAIVSYWNQQIFSGANTPPVTKPESEAIALVRATPGAIAYVSAGADTKGVRVVSVR